MKRLSSSLRAGALHDILEAMPVGVALLDAAGELLQQNVEFARRDIDLGGLAPRDKPLRDMGAHWYAGTIYHGKDNLAVGHIFMFDDREHVDLVAAEELLDLMALMVGTELRLRQAKQVADHGVIQARTDALTGLAKKRRLTRITECLPTNIRAATNFRCYS